MVIADHHLELSAARDLLASACEGNTQAFCQLLEPLQDRLLRQAVALTGDLSTAEDLVSEALAEAWRSLPHYDGTCRFSTWLFAILIHRHRKFIRRARSRPVSLAGLPQLEARELRERQEDLPAPELSPAESAAQREKFARLRQHVEMLPDKHRQVILLRFFEGASLPDMAAALGCSVGTVKSRLHHALEKLRKMKLNLFAAGGDKQT